MYFLFSGEGATDLGSCEDGVNQCEAGEYRHGPMAVIVDQIVEQRYRYSLLEGTHFGYVSERILQEHASAFKANSHAYLQECGPRSELGGVQVECLELWYGWHNGREGNLTYVSPLGRMLPIGEALENRRMAQDIPFVDTKRKNAFKILDEGAGDGFFLDIASATPRVFYHMLEDPFPRDFGTLQEFVCFIADVHAAGIASETEDGMVRFDLPRYQEVEAEYLARIEAANNCVKRTRQAAS